MSEGPTSMGETDMSTSAEAAHADLAYLRGVAENRSRTSEAFGASYFAAGLLYGGQTLLQIADHKDLIAFPPLGDLAIAVLPTLGLVAVIGWAILIARKSGAPGVSDRAINAVFEAAGLANLAILAAVAFVAASVRSFPVFLIYACAVFAFQGGAWHVAFRIKRRLWMLPISIGWLAVAVACGYATAQRNIDLFLAIVTVALFALMALPGFLIWRWAQKEARA